MHTPRQFRADSPSREGRLIRENPFGLLCSATGGVPVATHIPMLRRPGADGPPADHEALAGTVVIGHMARVNPQWRSVSPGQRVLAVFLGPDGYVTPTLYRKDGVVPTWNYAAVHVTGPIRVINEPEESLAVIHATIDATEAGIGGHWNPERSADYIAGLLRGITAFEITVEEVRSTFKLSQDKPEDVQRGIRDSFAHSARAHERELADLMSDVLGLGGAVMPDA